MISDSVADWIAREIVPLEADARRWLRYARLRGVDEDDVIQEAYCRVSGLSSFQHIDNKRAYFITVVRNIALSHLRSRRVVHFSDMAELEVLNIPDVGPSPETMAQDREALSKVSALIARLPLRVREVLLMRRVQGLSQKEIAGRLGVPESTIEKRAARGLDLLISEIETWAFPPIEGQRGEGDEKARKRN